MDELQRGKDKRFYSWRQRNLRSGWRVRQYDLTTSLRQRRRCAISQWIGVILYGFTQWAFPMRKATQCWVTYEREQINPTTGFSQLVSLPVALPVWCPASQWLEQFRRNNFLKHPPHVFCGLCCKLLSANATFDLFFLVFFDNEISSKHYCVFSINLSLLMVMSAHEQLQVTKWQKDTNN